MDQTCLPSQAPGTGERVMRLILAFCRGVGIVVVVSALLGAIVPGLNFRLCLGPTDRCVLKSEAVPIPSQGTAP